MSQVQLGVIEASEAFLIDCNDIDLFYAIFDWYRNWYGKYLWNEGMDLNFSNDNVIWWNV